MKWMDMGPFTVCHVGLVQTARDWRILMEEQLLGDHVFPKDACTTFFPETPLIVVSLRNAQSLPRWEALGYCVHEAVHVWQYIREVTKITRADREVEAYSVQWIAGWLIKELKL